MVGQASKQASKHACEHAGRQSGKRVRALSYVFVCVCVFFFFATNESCAKRSGIVQANNISGSTTMCPGGPGLTDEPGDRGPEQTDEPGDPGQSILAR